MVQHRLGQTGAARQIYEAVVAPYDWKAADFTLRDTWIYHIIRREAEKLIIPDAPATSQRQ